MRIKIRMRMRIRKGSTSTAERMACQSRGQCCSNEHQQSDRHLFMVTMIIITRPTATFLQFSWTLLIAQQVMVINHWLATSAVDCL